MNVNDDSAAASSLKSMQEFLRRGENARVKTCSLVTLPHTVKIELEILKTVLLT